jgi:hypothetical protein
MTLLARIGMYLGTQARFLVASLFIFGVPFAVIVLWLLSDFGEFAQVLGAGVSLLGALAWGVIMWHLIFKNIFARVEAAKNRAEGASSRPRGT